MGVTESTGREWGERVNAGAVRWGWALSVWVAVRTDVSVGAGSRGRRTEVVKVRVPSDFHARVGHRLLSPNLPNLYGAMDKLRACAGIRAERLANLCPPRFGRYIPALRPSFFPPSPPPVEAASFVCPSIPPRVLFSGSGHHVAKRCTGPRPILQDRSGRSQELVSLAKAGCSGLHLRFGILLVSPATFRITSSTHCVVPSVFGSSIYVSLSSGIPGLGR